MTLESLEDLILKPEVENALFAQFKRVSPLAAYDQIPIEYDENGTILNFEATTEATEFGKMLLNLRPDLHEHIHLFNVSNGSGKSVALSYTLALFLTDTHPTVNHKGIPAEYWLITNTHLLKTEYTKAFFQSPGILGRMDDVKSKAGSTILLPNGQSARIRAYWNGDGLLERIENVTNGKKILCFSFNQGDQTYAGQQPLVVCVDEMGEQAKKKNAANSFSENKWLEIINRVGRHAPHRGKWLILMCFTLVFEDWLKKVMRRIKKEGMIIPSIHPTKSVARVVQGKFKNPYLNNETLDVARWNYQTLGREDQIRIRQEGQGDEDPFLVFQDFNRPQRISITETQQYLKRSKIEKGWEFWEGIDPGFSDKCAVLFFLSHPIEGLILLDEIYVSNHTVDEVARLIKAKEEQWEFPIEIKRIFDPNYIKMTRMESEGLSNLKRWRKAGISGIPCPVRGRSYDSLFTVIKKNLLKYSEICKNFENELESHRKDEWGIPLEKDYNHAIDACRYVVNYYYMSYFNKYHSLDDEIEDTTPAWKKQYELEKSQALSALASQTSSNLASNEFFDSNLKLDDFIDDFDFF